MNPRPHQLSQVEPPLPGRVARLVREALEEEPRVWPRLGLVGPLHSGSHRDMDYRHFQASAAALEPYFADLVRLGAAAAPERSERARLARQLGLVAEGRMLAATHGRNTHKGAIFLLGAFVLSWSTLLRSSQGRGVSIHAALREATLSFSPLLTRDLGVGDSYGAWAYRRHGQLGVRGLVLHGFAPLLGVWRHTPLLDPGRPAAAERALGGARLLAAALSDDTNLVKRAGLAARERLRGEAYALWRRGGPLDPRNRRDIERLEGEVVRRGLSASASGDLTAMILLFRKMCHEGLATS